MRVPKILLLGLAVVIGLAALAVVALVWLVDPNDYRDEIERMVAQRTGRELVIEGDLALRLFPWLGVDVGAATLGDAAGFGPEPFLTVAGARLDVRLLPLLLGRVEVGEVVLEEPHLRLVTAPDGTGNWSTLATSPSSTHTPSAAAAPPSIARITVHHGRIELVDEGQGAAIALTDLELQTGRITPEEPFRLEVSLNMQGTQVPRATMSLTTQITAASDLETFTFAAPDFAGRVAVAAGKDESVQLAAQAKRIDVDLGAQRYAALAPRVDATVPRGSDRVAIELEAQRLSIDLASGAGRVDEFAVAVAGAQFTGNLVASGLPGAAALTGQIALARVSLRELLERLHIDAPQTRDPDALDALAMRADIAASGDRIALSNLDARLDESHITGRIAVTDFERRALEFDLDVDRIDLDRYLPPGAADEPPEEIPVELLRGQPARGELRIAEARLAGVRLEGVKLGVDKGADRLRTPTDSSSGAARTNGVQPSGDSRVEEPWIVDAADLPSLKPPATADAAR